MLNKWEYTKTGLMVTDNLTEKDKPHLSLMEMWNRLTNQANEYWYMGSMLGRSVMEKKSTDPWAATGWYPALDCSILRSVSSATC